MNIYIRFAKFFLTLTARNRERKVPPYVVMMVLYFELSFFVLFEGNLSAFSLKLSLEIVSLLLGSSFFQHLRGGIN